MSDRESSRSMPLPPPTRAAGGKFIHVQPSSCVMFNVSFLHSFRQNAMSRSMMMVLSMHANRICSGDMMVVVFTVALYVHTHVTRACYVFVYRRLVGPLKPPAAAAVILIRAVISS